MFRIFISVLSISLFFGCYKYPRPISLKVANDHFESKNQKNREIIEQEILQMEANKANRRKYDKNKRTYSDMFSK